MIAGRVNHEREALISVTLRAPSGQEEPIETVIDTGFNGFLTLPRSTVSRLKLPHVGVSKAELGDGSEVRFPVFHAVALWHDRPRDISVLQSDSAPVVGMALLHGSEMRIKIVDDGEVRIEPLLEAST